MAEGVEVVASDVVGELKVAREALEKARDAVRQVVELCPQGGLHKLTYRGREEQAYVCEKCGQRLKKEALREVS